MAWWTGDERIGWIHWDDPARVDKAFAAVRAAALS
jgi:hypothetical protein